ncbi:phosphotransferase [Levilactobacillus suantsaii]|nr:phosphotransferase [Levilactobacillus suantsaii]
MQNNFGSIYPAMIPVTDGERIIDRTVTQYAAAYDRLFIVVNAQDTTITDYIQTKHLVINPLVVADGLSLSESVAQALAQLRDQEPLGTLTIIFGDTVVKSDAVTQPDVILTHTVADAGRWTTVTVDDQHHLAFNDKVVPVPTSETLHAAVGVFTLSAGDWLAEHWQGQRGFYDNLCRYDQYQTLTPVDAPHWMDFGHRDKYIEAKKAVEARFFNHTTVDFKRGILRKESTDVDKFLGEIKWYLKLPKRLTYLAPRIFDYSLNYNAPFVEMEYFSYESLHNLFLYGNLEIGVWREIIDELFFLRAEMERYQVDVDESEYRTTVSEMYLTKTTDRLHRLIKEQDFFAEIADKPLQINGQTFPSLTTILTALPEVLAQSGVLIGHRFSIIHGDFCLSNVLYDNTQRVMRLIDPRGKFGRFDIYGDAKYDYAKMMHSFSGKYDCIISDMFQLEADTTGKINYQLDVTGNEQQVGELFERQLQQHLGDTTVYRQIQLIEALLFLSMIPLHKDKPERQKAMLAVGVTKFAPFMAQVRED